MGKRPIIPELRAQLTNPLNDSAASKGSSSLLEKQETSLLPSEWGGAAPSLPPSRLPIWKSPDFQVSTRLEKGAVGVSRAIKESLCTMQSGADKMSKWNLIQETSLFQTAV